MMGGSVTGNFRFKDEILGIAIDIAAYEISV